MSKIVTTAMLDAAAKLTGDALTACKTLDPDRAAALGFGLARPAHAFVVGLGPPEATPSMFSPPTGERLN